MCRQNLKLLIIWASIFVFVTVNACSKSGDASLADIRTLHVLEFKTNSPIAEANVYLNECTRLDPYGCLADSIIGKLTTDKDGSFQYNARLNIYSIAASHNNYWSDETGGNTGLSDIYLTPVAYTKIHLKKINTHQPGLLLALELNKDPAPLFSFGIRQSYDMPADTTVLLESFGNNNNSIYWYFTDNAGTIATETGGILPDYYINRFDTATAEVNY